MKKLFILLFLFGTSLGALDHNIGDPRASVDGKYYNLVQVMECPRDRRSYGEYKDYGYWEGGAWCGQQGKEGYWVWLHPRWYVWAKQSISKRRAYEHIPAKASVDGKYKNLIQKLKCERDRQSYGDYRDYGYWVGGAWCGQYGKAGYWVWVTPYWYVWSFKSPKP